MNSQANSVPPGDWISIYGTGMSQTYLGGAAAPTTPLDTMSTVPAIWFDLQALPYNPDWAGLAPGYAGLDQINVQVPPAVREGCAVPVQASYQDDNGTLAVTQPLTVAIRQGGGPCADPPAQSYGLITWQKTVSTTEPYAVSETDIMTASLQSSPGQRAPASPSYSDGCPPPSNVCNASLQTSQTIFGPACGVPGYRSLAAGTVTVQGPGLSATPAPQVPFLEGQLGGLSSYEATFSSGTIQAGKYAAAASGGADVGSFQAAIEIGADIQIQTTLAGVNVFQLGGPACSPLTINWAGGDPNSWVTVRLIQSVPPTYGGYQFVNWAYRTRTVNGTMTIPAPVPPANGCDAAPAGPPITISIEVDPDPSEIGTFSASGLSLGGQVTWKYVHNFQAYLAIF